MSFEADSFKFGFLFENSLLTVSIFLFLVKSALDFLIGSLTKCKMVMGHFSESHFAERTFHRKIGPTLYGIMNNSGQKLFFGEMAIDEMSRYHVKLGCNNVHYLYYTAI